MQASEPDKGAVPMEVYRLEAPDLAVTYRRRTSEVTLEITGDSDLLPGRDHLPGTYSATATNDHATGLHADATLYSEVNRTVTLTLLLPEIQWEAIVGEAARFTGVAVVTVFFFQTYMTDPYAKHQYRVRHLEGIVSMEV